MKRATGFATATLAVAAIVTGVVLWIATRPPETPDVHDAMPEASTVTHARASNAVADASAEAEPDYPVEHEASTVPTACWDRFLANRDALAAKLRAVDGCVPTENAAPPELGCLAIDDATWTTDLIDASVVEDCALDFQLRFTRIADSGTAVGAPFTSADAWNESHRIVFEALGDYDHDGLTEVLATVTTDMKEGLRASTSTVLTVRDGGVVAYAPAASFEASDAIDIDHDGIVDLVGRGAFGAVTVAGNVSEWRVAPKIFAAHALADGTFSTTDAVARDYTTRACAKAPAAVTGKSDDIDADALAIVCARVRGTPTATIDAWIARACPDDAGLYACAAWETTLAAVTP